MSRAVARLASLAFALVAICASAVHAQPARPKGIPPELAPFMDDNTLMVAQVDLAAIGFDPTADRVLALLKLGGLPAKDLAEAEAGARGLAGGAKQWVTAFGAAGGERLFVVVNFNQQTPAYVVVPFKAGGDVAGLTDLLRGGAEALNMAPRGPDGKSTVAVVQVGNVLVAGPAGAVRMAKLTTANDPRVIRDDLAAAMSVAGDGSVRVAFAPPTLVKRGLATAQPKLPAELGGGATGDLTDAFRYAGLSVSLPAAQGGDLGLSLTVKATDAAGAAKLKKVADDVRALAAKEAVNGKVAGADKLLAMAEPKLDGDRLVLALGPAQFEAIAKTGVPMAVAARERAKSQLVASNMRQILLGVILYANEKGGRLPDRLPDDLAEYLGGKESAARVWSNPSRLDQTPPFVYLKPADKLSAVKNASETVILYEAYTAWPADGVSVGYADGHVETVASEPAFKKLIAKK